MLDIITDHIDIWTSAKTPKTNGGRGRSKNGEQTQYGIKKLREMILDLAVRGKLVSQDSNDEPASVLLEKINKEREKLIKAGKIRKQESLPKVEENEKPFELPPNWVFVRLGDVAYPQAGFAFKSRFFNENSEGLPLIRIRDVGQKFNGTYYSGEYRKEFLVERGDYLISMDGEFRVSAWPNGKALLNQRVARLIFFYDEVSQGFIADSLQGRLHELQGVKAYTTVDHLSATQISESVIGLPPLAEQRRITAKVDELMALCDQLEQQQNDSDVAHKTLVETLLGSLTNSANADDFQKTWKLIENNFDTLFVTEHSIDQLKKTILQLAVMGRLVSQDSADEAASILLGGISREKTKLINEGKIKVQKPLPKIEESEKLFNLPCGWEYSRFGEIAQEVSTGPFGSMIHKNDYIHGGVPLINPSHMINSVIVEDPSVAVTKAKAKELESYKLRKGDIVMARRGEMGRCALVDERSDGWLCGTGSFILRFNSEICRPYILLLFQAEYVRNYLAGEAVGTTMTNLNHGILNKMPIMLPPAQEQRRIVIKVNELMSICDFLKKTLIDAQFTQAYLADAIVERADLN